MASALKFGTAPLITRLPAASTGNEIALPNPRSKHYTETGCAIWGGSPQASALALDLVRADIDACVTLPDYEMSNWVKKAWSELNLRLEPSAASGFAAMEHFHKVKRASAVDTDRNLRNFENGTHIIWTTGGQMLPDLEFKALLDS